MACPDGIPPIIIKNARTHNLQGVDLEIPHHRLVVVTGVSGSGKSSLAFDTICREGQRRYLESFSTRARQLLGKLGQAEVDDVRNLGAAIALDQKTSVRNPRSTMGTLSELNGHLRLLFARLGEVTSGEVLHRADFSFNSSGACESCRGLGIEESIDPAKLIDDEGKTLREGALVITTDSGYIIYSQVTMEVLNQVCQAHDFDVDIPWRDLSPEQRKIILYGSDRIEIPFGKHTLESRMKWSGIKARPRQTGHYGGIVPVMDQILRRDRNKNILRFVRSGPCAECGGTRLNAQARSVRFAGQTLPGFLAFSVTRLHDFFNDLVEAGDLPAAGVAIGEEIQRRCALLMDLGLGYLTLDRDGPSLSGGEAQRIRLASLVGSQLRGITYVLDEPSLGLHPRDQQRLLKTLRRLVDQGNTVIAVEHDRQTMLAADWLVDLGPGAGADGGRVLYNGPVAGLLADKVLPVVESSLTRRFLLGQAVQPLPSARKESAGVFTVVDAQLHNLKNLVVEFQTEALNVVSGVSGAGKSSLLAELSRSVKENQASADRVFAKIITIDQAPIGRTPRSNPATYTGLFDHLRTLFAKQPLAMELQLGKGLFSFNNKGGRCSECEGAGVKRLGMHFLGDVEIPCEKCGGRRFGEQILQVKYRGLNISEVLALPLFEAAEYFADQKNLTRHLNMMVELGLGYLSLGQPSTTLSGGEAQRIKLAAELSRPESRGTGGTLYILDEPTSGLHEADVAVLLKALDGLVAAGGTVVVSEHHEAFLRFADRVIDLGPESGADGGHLVFAGNASGLIRCQESITGQMLLKEESLEVTETVANDEVMQEPIRLMGVQTNNLQNLDVDFPVGKITVVTGVSGSGKSSLALDTLYAEGRARYAENFSTYIRQQLSARTRPDLADSRGLTPSVAIVAPGSGANPRSTVATATEIHPLLRLLFSRTGQSADVQPNPSAGFFSFNHHAGACEACRGLGTITACDPQKLVSDPNLSLLAGALDGHKTGRFYGETDGQFVATLRQVGQQMALDFEPPWKDLGAEARQVAMFGTGDASYAVTWEFQRGKNKGQHHFEGPWIGFCGLVDDEYQQKHADRRGQNMLPVMSENPCGQCGGRRLGPVALAITCAGHSIADLCALSVDSLLNILEQGDGPWHQVPQLREEMLRRLLTMKKVGLGYLTLDRSTGTLSSGEYRRMRLVQQLGVNLQGLTCVLDEPTLGLHPRDTDRLWQVIEDLRDQGNTVVLVEHDPQVILSADHVIDVGPGAGQFGGRIVAEGTADQIRKMPHSVTGQWLDKATVGPRKRAITPGPCLEIRGASCNNLKSIDLDIPLGVMTAVVGVSGSGKSSLVFGALAATAEEGRTVGCRAIGNLDQFRNVVSVRPAAASARSAGHTSSNPATVSGLAPLMRNLLAKTPAAERLGLAARHFSTAGKGGRCESCKGTGQLQVSLDFLADVSSPCSSCQGTGFQEKVLECCWQGLNIHQVLALGIGEALEFFQGQAKIVSRLKVLQEAGLSYLGLGQSTGSLSGGERQRLNLACRLLPGSKGPDLILCDEPTAGLHMADIDQLARLLRGLTDAGHTVVFTEHNQQLISQADQVVELGPGAGEAGGRLQSVS